MRRDLLLWIGLLCSAVVLAFICWPLAGLISRTSPSLLLEALKDEEVQRSLLLSLFGAFMASVLSFFFGTPFAYLLARRDFKGKGFIESLIDLPIVIPHPVIGIAILSVVGRGTFLGDVLSWVGARIVGTKTGIVTVMAFVGMPFYLQAAKNAFEMVPVRLERVARTLGASSSKAFLTVTFPLSSRSVLSGLLMCSARAISEFGAVVVVAYHPMTAPVLIYERFESFGLNYSRPVAVLLISISILLFVTLRLLAGRRR